MKYVALLICLLSFSGCSTYREFRAAPDRYTSIKVGDLYELQEDMLLLKYDYLIVPLVKPGIQLMPASVVKEAELSKDFSIIGRAKKGDTLRISGYENEGGWIPCQGDWYMVNPMAAFMDGELKGKTIGVSFLCDENTDKLPFRTGKILFARPNDKFIKKKMSISLGMSSEKAAAAVKELGAVDITYKIGWKYGVPLKATFWELKDYDTAILLIERHGKLSGISYWARRDFFPKDRRAETEQEVKAFTADTKTKRISIEKAK